MSEKKSSRLRAAPSPTGKVHIGNLRTFLYNYLFVKKEQGKFILRIEDTDKKRKVEGGTEAIIEVLKLYGINFDEGPIQGGEYGPYVQTEREDLYKEHAEEMISNGFAYRCFCSSERLQKMRDEQTKNGEQTGYDGFCRDLSEEDLQKRLDDKEKFVIRMKFPKDGDTRFTDEVYGDMKIPNSSIDDQVILKSDGLPTYHFAVVVDDHLMDITHVVRGREYLGDTPKNVFIYNALGWEIPKFIHVPHILKPQGKGKLGKRDGALPAIGYLKKGYIPEAILNYIALIGWSPRPEDAREDEIYSIDDMSKIFHFENIQKTGGRYDPKKLDAINGKYIRSFTVEELSETVLDWAENIVMTGTIADRFEESDEWELVLEEQIKKYLPLWKEDKEYFVKALEQVQERLVNFSQLPYLLNFFYDEKLVWNSSNWKFKGSSPSEFADALDSVLPELREIFESNDFSDHDSWEKIVRSHADTLDWNHGKLFLAIRSATTGRLQSPPLLESFEIMGWDRVEKNIQDAIKWLKEQ